MRWQVCLTRKNLLRIAWAQAHVPALCGCEGKTYDNDRESVSLDLPMAPALVRASMSKLKIDLDHPIMPPVRRSPVLVLAALAFGGM
jgi:hypothetical protein